MVAVDDEQLLDNASTAAPEQLVRRQRTAVLLTVRTGGGLAADHGLPQSDLAPLPTDQTNELLERTLDVPVEPATADPIWQASEGNPLLVHELMAAGRAGGALEQQAGRWRWDGRLALSARLTDLIRSQMGELSQAERGVLEMLSIGEPLSVTAVGPLETLQARELVRVRQDGRRSQVWLAHPLYGEVVRADLGRLRANRLRRELADDVSAAGGRRRGDVLRTAGWLLDSNSPAELLAEAARQAYGASGSWPVNTQLATTPTPPQEAVGLSLHNVSSWRRNLVSATAAALAVLFLTGTASPAVAADVQAGQWYLTALRVPQSQTISRGQGITVAVIDGGVDATVPALKGQVLQGTQFGIPQSPNGTVDTSAKPTTEQRWQEPSQAPARARA